MSKRQVIERERKELWSKDIVLRNPNFTQDQIVSFFELFNLYADQRRQCNILDIVTTAKTLGFDKKHTIVYEAMSAIANQFDGRWVGFEEFLIALTERLGNTKTAEGRRALFELVDLEGKQKLTIGDLLRISDHLHFDLTPDEIQQIVRKIGGPKAREITWEQFDEEVARKNKEK